MIDVDRRELQSDILRLRDSVINGKSLRAVADRLEQALNQIASLPLPPPDQVILSELASSQQTRSLAEQINNKLDQLNQKLNQIMASQAEEAALLQGIKTEFGSVLDEINAKIAALQAAIDAGGNTSPEVDAATSDLKSSMDAALAQFAPPPTP